MSFTIPGIVYTRYSSGDMSAHQFKAVQASTVNSDEGCIVVATRGHKLDAHCLRAAVATRARYVGLLGSRRKTVLIEKMLRDEDVAEERLRAVHAPIGLDLGGRTPAEIALSVLAEMSQERFGGNAGPLRLRT